jgi:predicted dehydrogenase/threonine dehydrogenase-like Zn-dependent dehydrogenase
MKQVVQELRSGNTRVREIPDPVVVPGALLVATVASLVSAGTERYVVDLAKKSLLGKARERPDHVRRVMQKVRQEGWRTTMSQVLAKLDEPMPLGYSSAGVVLECGRGVQDFKPGDRVAATAPHAGIVSIGRNLCASIPDGVRFDQACYASVGAIALEGIRLARVSLGERVLVIGLGLVGQLTVALLKAQGCRVFGTDIDPAKLDLARAFGADVTGIGSPRGAVRAFSGGPGVDAVIITAATASNEPIELAAEATRVRGRIVLVGIAGLALPRAPFFEKELEFTVSSSLGPGRADPVYEEKGIDYPIGHARWTARRNMEAVLETIAAGRLRVDMLTTHRFSIDEAANAYALVTTPTEPSVGIVIEYPADPPSVRRIELRPSVRRAEAAGLSLIGAGNFARLMLLPRLTRTTGIALRGVCTAKGLNAEQTGRASGFRFATTDVSEIFDDAGTGAVCITTRHNLHAELVIAALMAGKHVFVEKPLCITAEELEQIAGVVDSLGTNCPVLMVGFNRRFAPALVRLRDHFRTVSPLSVSFRFSPGPLPARAWPQDDEIGGGRIIGEACHAIDTCAALLGSPPVRVYAESVAMTGGLETTDDRVFISMRHANGSISNIAYQAGGDKAGPSERIEVFGGGRTGIVEGWDEIELWASDRVQRVRGGKDKGHAAELDAFVSAWRAGGPWPIPWDHLYGTTWASLAAVRSLREGFPVTLEPADGS